MSGELTHLHNGSATLFDRPGFFHSNLRIQEAVATIRYGIEARKGLIVLTSEAGAGKTTLLHKVTQELAVNVTWILESNPRLSFADVIGLLARNLHFQDPGDEESAMLRACKLHLRERLESHQIVALLIDNAHDLPDQTLRRMTQNFLAASAEDPDGSLLQLVLAGNRDLKLKLAELALAPLRRKPPVLCELHPIESREIGSFVRQWLTARDQPVDFFDERALKRVALYTRGKLRDINLLCERALQLASASNNTGIGAESIDHAAKDLDLREAQSNYEPRASSDFEPEVPKRLEKPGRIADAPAFDFSRREYGFSEPHERHGFADFPRIGRKSPTADPGLAASVGKQRDPIAGAKNQRAAIHEGFLADEQPEFHDTPARGKQNPTWLTTLAVLTILAAALVMFRFDPALDVLAGWNSALQKISSARAPTVEVKKQPDIPQPRIVDREPLVTLPGPDRPVDGRQESPPPDDTTPPSPFDSAPKSLTSDHARQSAAPASRGGSLPNNGARQEERRAPIAAAHSNGESLQIQVTRAIENRAIMGVEVSVVEGTAYLDGHVATERQRRAAERAARSVSGVQRVQNRIAITYG